MAKPKQNIEKVDEKSTKVAVHDYAAYAGHGFEDTTTEDYSVPFLYLLQSNSPVIETNAKARPGMIIDTATQDLYNGKEGIIFVPCHRQHVFVEWTPREEGGGFVAVHQLNDELIVKARKEQERGKYKKVKGDPKSNDLVDTFYVYGLLIDQNGSWKKVIIPFTSTKNKVYKRMMDIASQIRIPNSDKPFALFAHKYHLTTVPQKNKKGSFHNFQIALAEDTAEKCRVELNSPLWKSAVEFYEQASSNQVKVDYDKQVRGESDDEETETPFK